MTFGQHLGRVWWKEKRRDRGKERRKERKNEHDEDVSSGPEEKHARAGAGDRNPSAAVRSFRVSSLLLFISKSGNVKKNKNMHVLNKYTLVWFYAWFYLHLDPPELPKFQEFSAFLWTDTQDIHNAHFYQTYWHHCSALNGRRKQRNYVIEAIRFACTLHIAHTACILLIW